MQTPFQCIPRLLNRPICIRSRFQTNHASSRPSVPPRYPHQLSHTPLSLPDVTVVRDRRSAARVVAQLMRLPSDVLVAWDTETTAVNPAKESPVGKGRVICATAYAGPEVDFGSGPRLFVDCLDGESGERLLQVFKHYFESDSKKVWHNYSFDRHVLTNHNIVPGGFAGDTMHMARLVDSSRQRYALEELCAYYLNAGSEKCNMKDRFGRREILKNGAEGKKLVVPDTIELQRNAEYAHEWIDYSTADAKLTYSLCHTLKSKLEQMTIDGRNSSPQLTSKFSNLYELYVSLLVPFGQMMTDIERTGFKVNVNWLKKAEQEAEVDRLALEDKFRAWAEKHSPDARYMNINSDLQKQVLFFAPCTNRKDRSKSLPPEKSFCVEQTGVMASRCLTELASSDCELDQQKAEELKNADNPKVKKDIVLKGLGKAFKEQTASGWPSVSASAMKKLAGSPRATPAVYGDPSDPEMCLAIDDMISATSISTLVSTFIVPLQHWPAEDGRIHASLNLNTETGRLSSRRPNLQNQPSLEKDRYQVRNAFVAEEGKRLIVADYGQLELRLLAHITKCRSMLHAFKAGGDFHSRTAMTMFDNVAHAVSVGDCLLEKDVKSDSSVPLLKDMFSIERRKAKTLNFSIAYGKTVQGLAKDWNVDTEEARETLHLWYKERQEVKQWQRDCKRFVRENGYVETILGRRRHLPDIYEKSYFRSSHAERAAINAPLQGSAADLVMAAMVKLHHNRVLQSLGWKIILQVHDEIILEGPEESAKVALPIVVGDMSNPVDVPLLVDLTVDAKCAKTWYQAK